MAAGGGARWADEEYSDWRTLMDNGPGSDRREAPEAPPVRAGARPADPMAEAIARLGRQGARRTVPAAERAGAAPIWQNTELGR